MGGDAEPKEVERLSNFIRKETNKAIKTGWYSGKGNLPDNVSIHNFDYIKIGPYIEKLGGLNKETTNQRFYKIEDEQTVDLTSLFQKKKHSVPF